MSEAKIPAYVPRTFNDAGTGQTFEGGKVHYFDAGAHGNYSAAGLLGEAPADAPAAASGAAPASPLKQQRKRAAH